MSDLLYIQSQLDEKLKPYIDSLRERYPFREDDFSGIYVLTTTQDNFGAGIYTVLYIDGGNLFFDCDCSRLHPEIIEYVNSVILRCSLLKISDLNSSNFFTDGVMHPR